MGSEFVTLAKLCGKPDFWPHKRLIACAETLVCNHLRKRKAGQALFPITVDDLTTLIEDHVAHIDLYEDISSYGTGVEGLTEFAVGCKPTVLIAPELSESRNQNRLKSTLAHELGHVILHDPMFQSKNQEGLFDSKVVVRQVSYRDGDVTESQGDLFEFQAWFFCRALLMPATEVQRLLQDLRTSENCYSDIWAESDLGTLAIQKLATHFGVSTALAKIHLLKTGSIVKNQPGPSLF